MKNKAFLFIAIFSTTLFACSKSKTEPEPESASITSVSQGLPVKRITHTFSVTENHQNFNWVFNYLPNKVISGTGQIFYTWNNAIQSETIRNINYTNNGGSISGSFGSGTFTGTLNTLGYLATLVFTEGAGPNNVSSSSFTYTSDGYLKSRVETFSGATQTTTYTYNGGNLVSVVEGTGANSITTTYQYGSILNKAGIIPPTLMAAGYEYHFFHYAALLGKPSKNLVSSLNTQSGPEVQAKNYTYTLNDGYVNTCSVNSIVTGTLNYTTSELVTYAYN